MSRRLPMSREKRLAAPRPISHPTYGALGSIQRFAPIDAPVWWLARNRKGRELGEFRTAKRAVGFLEYTAAWTPAALDLEPEVHS